VTGGLGFIGSHTCIELIEDGYNVLVIDSLSNSQEHIYSQILKILKLKIKKQPGKVYLRKGDIRDKNWLEDIFVEFKKAGDPIYSVIHCAGLKAVDESLENPLKYWDWNITTTLNLLLVMERQKCFNLVFSSSATVYGCKDEINLTENSQKSPLNPYGNTKLTIEILLSDLYKSSSNKWRIALLRYFNPAGSHASGLIGENPNYKPKNLFPLIVKTALSQNTKLSIFGNNWPTKDGTCIRDYIHITDLANAHVATLNLLISNKPQIIALNIGTGKGHSVLQVLETFMRVNNVSVPYVFQERRKGDHYYAVANNELALSLLNWQPVKTLEDICRDSWNFAKIIS
tara:strand:- start:213 stop:1241 length:1029 start_codon:yes stop_codon:yes gene_type:complete